MKRTLLVTEDLVRRYSRRGNFHSEHATAESLGLPGLVAQGTQVAGPAYGLLLDSWGEEFLATGSLDVRFVGMTVAGETVTATVELGTGTTDATIEGGADATGVPADTAIEANAYATIEVVNVTSGAPVVVGTAQRTSAAGRGAAP
jgi:acyl dehydratase